VISHLQKKNRSHSRIAKWLRVGLLVTFMGFLLIWRSNAYERVSTRMLVLERLSDSLAAETSYLSQEMIDYADYTVIEKRARDELNMVPPDTKPVEVHIAALPEQKEIGAMSLFRLSFGR